MKQRRRRSRRQVEDENELGSKWFLLLLCKIIIIKSESNGMWCTKCFLLGKLNREKVVEERKGKKQRIRHHSLWRLMKVIPVLLFLYFIDSFPSADPDSFTSRRRRTDWMGATKGTGGGGGGGNVLKGDVNKSKSSGLKAVLRIQRIIVKNGVLQLSN